MRIGARDCWGEDVMGLLKITVLDVWVVYLEHGGSQSIEINGWTWLEINFGY